MSLFATVATAMPSAIQQHLVILPVLLPLIAAPLCMLARRASFAWGIAFIASLLLLLVTLALVGLTSTGVGSLGLTEAGLANLGITESGAISYAVGGWQPPYGIELRVDRMSSFVLLLIAVVATAVLPYARISVEREVPSDRIHLFYTCLLLCITGLIGMTITGDAFNVFVFLEISSLSTYALIAMGSSTRALTAAYRYLIMGTIGGTFFLIGVGLLYAMTGTLNMADMSNRLAGLGNSPTVLAAAAFIATGMGLKLAMFPLHSWLPNAYSYAPSVVTALVAGTGTKVAVYILLRFYFTVFGNETNQVLASDGTTALAQLLLVVGCGGLVICSFVALFQTDVKRLLAYSSVAQIGYILIGIGLANGAGMTGAIVHLFNHAIIKAGLFLAVGAMVWRCSSPDLAVLAGIGRRMPLTGAAFVIGGLGLIGVPLTAGFISKWYLVLAAIEQSRWLLVALLLSTSLLALGYVGRVIEVAYFRTPDPRFEQGDPPLTLTLSIWFLVALTVFFGVQAEMTVNLAQQAASALLPNLLTPDLLPELAPNAGAK